jgi:hypothetical protein
MEHIGYDRGIKRSRVCRIVRRAENIPIKDGMFHPPGKKVARNSGCARDFGLYKGSVGEAVRGNIRMQGDSGCQGITDIHANSETPKNAGKLHKLTKEEKADNRRISGERIIVEHINAVIKVFKIMSYPYRNRRKRHLPRLSLICAIINYEKSGG